MSHDRELADMLTGRWRAYHVVGSRLVEVPVEHEPWPLRNAELVACDESLLVRAGFDPRGEPPLVHFAAGVDARLGPPRLTRHKQDRAPRRRPGRVGRRAREVVRRPPARG